MVTQGAWVRHGSILGEGSVLNPSIPVIDAETGEEVSRGIVPPNCVVVRAERKREFPGGDFYLPCALIIRRLAEGERSHVNEILREHGVSV
jgi:2,3,4,5-tetrahydropyridine-2-carboxylate N-succinyltransferase